MRISDMMTPVQHTTYGLGPYHPAIMHGDQLYYWPNRTFPTEQAALEASLDAVCDLIMACDAIAKEWNVMPIQQHGDDR